MPGKKHDFARQADLVNGIAYSSDLGGRTESCFDVLDSEQQGLSDDGLKVILDLIFRPAQPREDEKKILNLKDLASYSTLTYSTLSTIAPTSEVI